MAPYFRSISFLLVMISATITHGQGSLTDSPKDNGDFLASTKQVGQFFKRFNGEEDVDGKRFQPEDRRYRDHKVRKNYLPLLIDPEVVNRDKQLANDFFF